MTNRITEKMIQARVDYLNKITGSPMQPYAKNENGEMKAQIGNFSHVTRLWWCLHSPHDE